MSIGIISEGPTDQIVLENILFGFTGDKNLAVNQLQPLPGAAGNWDMVFRYCASADFRQAFEFLDFVIVQIDIDFMRRQEVPAAFRFPTENRSAEELAGDMRQKLTEAIGHEFFTAHGNRIAFAIAVDSIECWFLPIYFSNKPKIAAKTTNCLAALNQALPQREGFSIVAKEEKYYRAICKNFRKTAGLQRFAQSNPSLGWFLEDLKSKIRQSKNPGVFSGPNFPPVFGTT